MLNNLQNPMFPQDKFLPAILGMIQQSPFEIKLYDVLEQKVGTTDEVVAIRKYFLGR